jgi:hypothetical protein
LILCSEPIRHLTLVLGLTTVTEACEVVALAEDAVAASVLAEARPDDHKLIGTVAPTQGNRCALGVKELI